MNEVPLGTDVEGSATQRQPWGLEIWCTDIFPAPSNVQA